MKKLTICIFSAVLAIAIAIIPSLSRPATGAYADYFVEGGRFTVDFNEKSDENYFQLFTEFDKKPWVMDGKLFCYTLAEQKIILKNYVYTNVEVSVDLSTINECGKIDAGIYLQASNPNYQLDSINAWCVNVEHGASEQTFNLKLHRFENKTWKGAKVEIMGIKYTSDTVHLRAVLKDGIISAFINNETQPRFSYNVGVTTGQVGLRSFYAPNVIDNFTVTGAPHEVDRTYLNELVSKAENALTKSIPESSKMILESAIIKATSSVSQLEVDQAISALEIALESAVEKYTFAELCDLIAQADAITNPEGKVYTANSWNALIAVKNICSGLTEESSEYEISYWAGRLQAKINGLVPYITEVVQ